MSPLRWNAKLTASAIVAVFVTAAGFIASRPDVVVLALPFALIVALGSRVKRDVTVEVECGVQNTGGDPRLRVMADSTAELTDIDVQFMGERAHITTLASHRITVPRPIYHSGPVELARVTARGVAADGAATTDASPTKIITWNVDPDERRLGTLPVRRRLLGLYGAHPGAKQGDGGDFRDLHEFQPGDDLRRVDWRATARMARNPGDLVVRRTNTLSEANVYIAVDNTQNLGTVVRTWSSGDERDSGVTSMDFAREAALAIAMGAIGVGDRVGYLELVPGGQTIRTGSGKRHLDRLRSAIAATGTAPERGRMRRSPAIPSGSTIYVIAAFIDGSARDLALRWQATGHRVIAIDVLPHLLTGQLVPEQQLALRIVNTERAVSFRALRGAGIDVVRWAEPETIVSSLQLAARVRRR